MARSVEKKLFSPHSDEQSLESGFYINDVIILPNTNEIILLGKRSHLSPKPMAVLLYLIENRERIVSGDELLEIIWKNDTQIQHQNGTSKKAHSKVSHVISELRQQLDDHKQFPEFIQTHTKQGYQFIASIKPVSKSIDYSASWPLKHSITPPSGTQPHHPHQYSTKWHMSLALLRSSKLFSVSVAFIISTWVLIQAMELIFSIFNVPEWGMKIVLLLLVIGFPMILLYTWLKEIKVRKHLFSKHNESRRKKHFFRQLAIDLSFIGALSIAVGYLAFYLVESIENDQQAFTEPQLDLTLMQVPVNQNSIAILPFTAQNDSVPSYFVSTLQGELESYLTNNKSFKLISKNIINDLSTNNPKELRRMLGVNYVLNGSVIENNSEISVKISLENTETFVRLWSINLTDKKSDLLILQSRLLRQVSNALVLITSDGGNGNVPSIATKNIKAYDLYIQAKEKLENVKIIGDYTEVERLLLMSLQQDPQFFQASSTLCQSYLNQYEMGKAIELFNQARETCLTVLAKVPSDPESLVAMGNLMRIKGNYVDAEDYLLQVIVPYPEYIPAMKSLALIYQKQNRLSDADDLYRSIVRLEPGYWKHYMDYGDFLFVSGRYLDSASQFLRVTLLKPNNELALNRLGASFYLANKFNRATEYWAKSLVLNPSAGNYSNLGTANFFSQQFRRAQENYEKAIKLQPNDPVLWGNLADAQKYNNKIDESVISFKMALDLANDSIIVNSNDASLQATKLRFESELSQCVGIEKSIEDISTQALQDPYIYYDLSIAAKNCKKVSLAKLLIKTSITFGYSIQLLQQDIQFNKLLSDFFYSNETRKKL